MAAVNLNTASTINGRTVSGTLSNTASVLLSNAASSNKLLRIRSIRFFNANPNNNLILNYLFNTAAAGGGTSRRLYTVSLGPQTYVFPGTVEYLDENQSLIASSSSNAANNIEYVISYEEITQ